MCFTLKDILCQMRSNEQLMLCFTIVKHKLAALQTDLKLDEEFKVVDADAENNDDQSFTSSQSQTEAATAQKAASVEKDAEVGKGHHHATLKASMPTRWNSVLTMIESIIDLRDHANEVLKSIGKYTMCLQEDDSDMLQQLRTFLAPFKTLTLLMSEASPNMSVIPLVRTKIQQTCASTTSDSEHMRKVKSLVLESLDKRIPISKLTKLSACFDPAVRDAVLTPVETSKLVNETYADLATSVHASIIFPSKSADYEMLPASGLEDAGNASKLRLQLIRDTISQNNKENTESETSPLAREMSKYLTMHDDQLPTLEFWRANSEHLPLLAKMARIYLALSPTSVPVECMFSTSGLVLNSKRSSLAPFKMSAICFVHDNYRLLV